MATFAGIYGFFGLSPTLRTVDNPTKEQLNSFFGLDGTEALAGGFEGRVTFASGVLYGVSLVAHNLAVESFRAFNNGRYYPLIDTRGVAWPYVKLHTFEPDERCPRIDFRGYYTPYKATLRHLI